MEKILSLSLIIILLLVVVGYYTVILPRRVNPISGNINPKAYDGPNCEMVGECNNLVAINCMAETDGPFYYVDAKTGDIVSRCGGFCFTPKGCPDECPPSKWICD